jgi:hypothetical protein
MGAGIYVLQEPLGGAAGCVKDINLVFHAESQVAVVRRPLGRFVPPVGSTGSVPGHLPGPTPTGGNLVYVGLPLEVPDESDAFSIRGKLVVVDPFDRSD